MVCVERVHEAPVHLCDARRPDRKYPRATNGAGHAALMASLELDAVIRLG
jgi:hypothetical protein